MSATWTPDNLQGCRLFRVGRTVHYFTCHHIDSERSEPWTWARGRTKAEIEAAELHMCKVCTPLVKMRFHGQFPAYGSPAVAVTPQQKRLDAVIAYCREGIEAEKPANGDLRKLRVIAALSDIFDLAGGVR